MCCYERLKEYQLEFSEKARYQVADELYLDWSGLSQTGAGNPLVLNRIDRLVMAGFSQSIEGVSEDFLRSRSLATQIYEHNVAGKIALPLDDITDFEGFDTELNWLIALECSLCLNPAPLFVTELVLD